jgi:hypothetical protein
MIDLKFIYLSEIYNCKKKITIEVDISVSSHVGGPTNFIKGIRDFLPYNTAKCYFIPSKNIFPFKGKKNSN